MNRIRPDLDIVLDLLKETLAAYPTSKFIPSLLHQYQERGSLSKKQLQGLYHKAAGVSSISPAKIATLEAIILKKPNRYKSPSPLLNAAPEKDAIFEKLIDEILAKFPAHKTVKYIKLKLDNHEAISTLEKGEIERFHKILIKQ